MGLFGSVFPGHPLSPMRLHDAEMPSEEGDEPNSRGRQVC